MLACPGWWTSESRATTSYARGSHSPVLARMHQLKNKHAVLSNMHKITNMALARTRLVSSCNDAGARMESMRLFVAAATQLLIWQTAFSGCTN